MRLSLKIVVAFLAGIIALVALLYFNFFSNDYFAKRQKISEKINAIETAEKALDYQILQSGFFLYPNQDEIINKINSLEKIINTLRDDPYFTKNHPKTLHILERYNNNFQEKIESIYDFQTSNSAVKNATMSITALKKEAIDIFDTTNPDERLFLREFTTISTSVLLAKNSLDSDMIEHLGKGISALKQHDFQNSRKKEINIALIRNLKVFKDFFPQYKKSIGKLDTSETKKTLLNLRQSFFEEDAIELLIINYFSYFLITLYISSLGLIIYFLILSEKEARTDHLTGLGNRKAYKDQSRNTTPSALFLVNINKFKNYNDFYGIASGDKILVIIAQRLSNLCASWNNPKFYRVGGDEFGILIKYEKNFNLEALAEKLLVEFKKEPIIIEGIESFLSITLAVSTQSPLLETADMALKSIKKDYSKELILYHKGLNLQKIVQENMIKTRELYNAVTNDRLIPHFQPIVSFHTGEIEKYETLARLIMEDGEIKSIFEYLDVIKESKYYPTLTRIMVQKSFEVMRNRPHQFSLNLSIDDITNYETVTMIQSILQENPEIAKRVVFEILESEALHDHSNVVNFIKMVKDYGCHIAIDDFGSGYSNFNYLLTLDIDIIKIDGSLIQHIDTNPNALLIVETIVDFARKAKKTTIAEFVCSEAVYNIVKTIGIDYSQGYFTGKPEAI